MLAHEFPEIDWSDEHVAKLVEFVETRLEAAKRVVEAKGTSWDDTLFHRGRIAICKEILKLEEAATPPE